MDKASPDETELSSLGEPVIASASADASLGQKLTHVSTVADVLDPSVPPLPISSTSTLDTPEPEKTYRRRIILPLVLFLATCGSTYLTGWEFGSGLTYMICVMAVLLAHEMGHFLQTVRYRVPASFPYFIPLPFSPLGTMGAVIGMQGSMADRKQLFDIGISGPLAGLVVALPLMWIGIQQAVPIEIVSSRLHPIGGGYQINDPLIVQWMIQYLHPNHPASLPFLMNPYYLAGWAGLFVTGLNMFPVGQFDGGHITYALLGKKAHYMARLFMLTAIGSVVVMNYYHWIPMILLALFLVKTDHPPSSDDTVELGLGRTILGYASLILPILCFTPNPISGAGF